MKHRQHHVLIQFNRMNQALLLSVPVNANVSTCLFSNMFEYNRENLSTIIVNHKHATPVYFERKIFIQKQINHNVITQ